MGTTTGLADQARPPADGGSDEAELGRGLLASDEHAFEAAYRRWSPLVHAMAARSLGDAREAEDVTQQVFAAAWRGRAGFRPERGPLGAWLTGITRRKIVDALEGRTRRLRLAEAVARSSGAALSPAGGAVREAAPDAAPDAVLDRVLLADELARLPHGQRQVLCMAYYGDLTQNQIARLTGVPLGTVKSHARRGLQVLRRRIGQGPAAEPRPEGGAGDRTPPAPTAVPQAPWSGQEFERSR